MMRCSVSGSGRLPLVLLTVLSLTACGPATQVDDPVDGTVQPGPDGGGGCTGADCFNNCPAGTQTSISGVVTAPNGIDPVPKAMVYVPVQISEFPDTIACEVCSQISDNAVVATETAADGTFTLEYLPTPRNATPGFEVQIVSQKGRFRKVSNVAIQNPCAPNDLSAQLEPFRLPGRNQHPDAIPSIAVATGDYDSMECVLLKLGLEQGQFDLYEGVYEGSSGLPTFEELLRGNAYRPMNEYNIIFINCAYDTWEALLSEAQIRQNLLDYVANGGRLYVTDWSYDYIEQINDFAGIIDFEPGASPATPPEGMNEATLGEGDIQIAGHVEDADLASWLRAVEARSGDEIISSSDTVEIGHFLGGWVVQHEVPVADTSKVWITGSVPDFGDRPLTTTFDFQSCGRGLYSSYHTLGRDLFNTSPFPGYCAAGALSPQERILEYLILHIADCIVVD